MNKPSDGKQGQGPKAGHKQGYIGEAKPVDLDQVYSDLKRAGQALLELTQLPEGSIVVVGCSTSEIEGIRIGCGGSSAIAEAVMKALFDVFKPADVFLAIQGCEHVNRALVVEADCALTYGARAVNVYPVAEAGGSLAAYAMEAFEEPVVVEEIEADAGIDIGDTFIGMHLKPVPIPLRVGITSIGHAHLTLAGSRPKLIGGERAVYRETRLSKRVHFKTHRQK